MLSISTPTNRILQDINLHPLNTRASFIQERNERKIISEKVYDYRWNCFWLQNITNCETFVQLQFLVNKNKNSNGNFLPMESLSSRFLSCVSNITILSILSVFGFVFTKLKGLNANSSNPYLYTICFGYVKFGFQIRLCFSA